MSTSLPSDAKQSVLRAYQKFQSTLATISKQYHASVGRVITDVDQKKAEDIRQTIQNKPL